MAPYVMSRRFFLFAPCPMCALIVVAGCYLCFQIFNVWLAAQHSIKGDAEDLG